MAAFFLREILMHLSAAGLELLKKCEGFRDHAYLDAAGYRTIGFGHRLTAGDCISEPVDLEQAGVILESDVLISEAAIDRLVKVPLTQGQFDALADFVFNLGAGRLASSTLLVYLNAGRYDAAAWQLLAWDHAGSRELASLKARREAEFELWAPAGGHRSAAA